MAQSQAAPRVIFTNFFDHHWALSHGCSWTVAQPLISRPWGLLALYCVHYSTQQALKVLQCLRQLLRCFLISSTLQRCFQNVSGLWVNLLSVRSDDIDRSQTDLLKLLPLFHDLTHLTLSLDFKIAANDTFCTDHNQPWYRHCFLCRFDTSEDIAKVCPGLQHCGWLQLRVNSEGNDNQHDFVILEAEGNRVIKPVMQWWMAKDLEHHLI